jgi:iron complex transport system ATP-binding protein
MITVEHLAFTHAGRAAPILADVSFSVAKGSLAALIGPNGAGKTTLFRCLCGMLTPQAGRLAIGGEDAATLSIRERAQRVALVPQDHTAPFAYPIEDVILTGRAAHLGPFAAPGQRDREAALNAARAVGVEGMFGRAYTTLSGGERQLVLIARALAQETPALLLDEPTAHLDFANQFRVLHNVRELVKSRGLTALMTLHDPNLASQFCDHVIMLHGGGILAEGRPDDVMVGEKLSRLYGVEVKTHAVAGRRIALVDGAGA